jgi:hypothetical protein
MNMQTDWRYNEEKMELRQAVYNILLNRFGGKLKDNGEPVHSMQKITECAHDWVSQGHVSSSGVVKYFQAYYS